MIPNQGPRKYHFCSRAQDNAPKVEFGIRPLLGISTQPDRYYEDRLKPRICCTL